MTPTPSRSILILWTSFGWRVTRVDSLGQYTSGCLDTPLEALGETARSLQVLVDHEKLKSRRRKRKKQA